MWIDADGWLQGSGVLHRNSPYHDARPGLEEPSLLLIHGISLPAGQFGGPWIDALFMGTLDATCRSELASLAGLRVSAHFLIRRDGQLLQYVSTRRRAWHAGQSQFQGRQRCNDFSIGVELEGTDHCPYENAQYEQLLALSVALRQAHPLVAVRGHEHVAPGRKTDPGPAFDWGRLAAARVWNSTQLPPG
jgi:AmpD protein